MIVATAKDAAGSASFSVVDVGEGITAEVAKRLFQPFVTSKPKGLGLGLSICRSIVEAHGGQLTASNNAKRGATFSVVLPTGIGAAQ